MTSVGINLASITYWSTEEPFIDRFKTSGTWGTYSGNGTVAVDERGYPLGIPAGEKSIRVSFAVDPVEASPVDTYVMTFSGTATIRQLNGATILSQTENSITFTPKSDCVSVNMEVATMSSSDPIRDIHVVRTDQIELFNQGVIFNPEFIVKTAKYDTLRFMDWQDTNALAAVSWDDRPMLDDASWARSAVSNGAPLEIMVALANETHSDMWYNVPTMADDAYVATALAYIRDNLDPSLKLHVEYSNETWNTIFEANDYASALGLSLLGSTAETAATTYHGYRAAQVAAIGKEVFADEAEARLVNVLAVHTANVDRTVSIVAGIAQAGLGAAADLFSDYAIATYFGLKTVEKADRATIMSWARAGQAGVDAAIHELEFGGTLRNNQSLARLEQHYAVQALVAESLGLNLVAYEGGSSMVASKFAESERDLATSFFAQVSRDTRMYDLYTRMIEGFEAVGGTALNAYHDVGDPGTSGYWGTLDTIYDEHSARYDALMAAAKGALSDVMVGSDGAETLTGSLIDEVIYAGSGNDRLIGGGGDNLLYGGVGNDTLYDGSGSDRLYGETGNDLYIVKNARTLVFEDAKSGTDTVEVYFGTYVLPDNVEKLVFKGTGNFTGTGNASSNTINGGKSIDKLYGLAGNDKLSGGLGNDYIDGGAGADTLTGGDGADRFVFSKVSEIATGSAQDLVTDFSHAERDILDFNKLDANTKVAGNQAFDFIGSAAFSGRAGELHAIYDAAKDMMTVSGDANGDKVADFSVYLHHVQSLAASDFLL